ncbi:hypothetical protein [uncultured Sulfitobacter sp.]|uniref:hypothetical protein n=1 Tax=uncultured Sulfitobacter sp. TaxID=191468 RepID=UPI00262F4F4C|nr:hypothetical protein [uncultured Sulfitobacter sp.]
MSKRYNWKGWKTNHGSGSGGTRGTSHDSASATKSYHNGGVEGDAFAKWYDSNLSKKFFNPSDRETNTDDTMGSGSGACGTKGFGYGGTKGSGSGGTKGFGFGGTKGSGSGGTKGSGSGGTKGSGSGGTKGSGSGGTKGTDTPPDNTPDDSKLTQSLIFDNGQEVTVSVTQTPEGQLFMSLRATSFENGAADIDGVFFNFSNNATLEGLNFFPDPLSLPVTGFEANADSVSELPDGTAVPGAYDAAVQFGQSEGSTDGAVNSVGFTLWSDNGPLSLDDVDLSSLTLVVNSGDGTPEILSDGVLQEETADEIPDDTGGTKGSGSGGTKGSGSGGTKGSGSGGTKGTGSGGTKGTGSVGTKGTGSGGTKGSGSGGTKGFSFGGKWGSGFGNKWGSGSGGTRGFGFGGTKGSGSGGTKGFGFGGTWGFGLGGTKGSGSGGTTGGYGQWSGVHASAAADTLPPFSAYPEDVEAQESTSVDDVLALMTQDIDETEENNWGTATAGGTGADLI